MNNRILTVILCVFVLFPSKAQERVEPLDGEVWWGLSNTDGCKQPFVDYPVLDLAEQSRMGETVPFLISNKGRYIWCDGPFRVSCEKGVLQIWTSSAPLEIVQAGSSLKDAYLAACEAHFPFDGTVPPEEFFTEPQFNNWIESVMTGINQESAERYVEGIFQNDFPCGIVMIDGGWLIQHGTMRFNPYIFPDGKRLFDLIKSFGYKGMLWISPYVSADNRGTYLDYRRTNPRKKPLMVESKDRPGDDCIIHWWSGKSVSLDLTDPEGRDAFVGQLKDCQELYGLDGFKFDGADAEYFRKNGKFHGGASTCDYVHAYGELCKEFPYNEFRVGYRNGGEPVIVRLQDVPHNWDKLPNVIYNVQVSGLMGLPYTIGDMIGGGLNSSFENDKGLSHKYVIRSCQVQALMPMMQFSMAPWRVLTPEECDICREMALLHVSFSDYIMEQVRHAAKTGEPIVRTMEYEFPGQGFDRRLPQFMLGPDYLVAPVVREDDSVTVELPKGRWKDDQGKVFRGPKVLRLNNVPLERLPYYKKLSK